MSHDELDRLPDHDLLLLLHERWRNFDKRMDDHEAEHRRGTATFRWTVAFVLSALVGIAAIAGVIGSLGNP